jgi:hypothetical protein
MPCSPKFMVVRLAGDRLLVETVGRKGPRRPGVAAPSRGPGGGGGLNTLYLSRNAPLQRHVEPNKTKTGKKKIIKGGGEAGDRRG